MTKTKLKSTNLQEAYLRAARVFVEIIVQGDPHHIAKKLEKCPLIKYFKFSDDSTAVLYHCHGMGGCEYGVEKLPEGVKIRKAPSPYIVELIG